MTNSEEAQMRLMSHGLDMIERAIEPTPKRKQATDWFGCGKQITTESWNGFLAARKAYYEELERKKKPNE